MNKTLDDALRVARARRACNRCWLLYIGLGTCLTVLVIADGRSWPTVALRALVFVNVGCWTALVWWGRSITRRAKQHPLYYLVAARQQIGDKR